MHQLARVAQMSSCEGLKKAYCQDIEEGFIMNSKWVPRIKAGDVTVYTELRDYPFTKEEEYFTKAPAAQKHSLTVREAVQQNERRGVTCSNNWLT